MDQSNKSTGERSPEERRFILWSIARANKKVQPGPFSTGFRLECQLSSATPVQINPVARAGLEKSPQFHRHTLLTSAARVGSICGGLIGFNVGLLAYTFVSSFVPAAVYLMLATSFASLFGMTVAKEYVRGKS